MEPPTESDSLAMALARRTRPRHGLRRALGWTAASFALLIVATAAAGAVVVAVFLRQPTLFVGCDPAGAHSRSPGQNSFLYASDGTGLGSVPSPWNRQPIPLTRMGSWLPAATVAIEDRRFWQRGSALDYQAILRAAVADIRARRVVQGGSTIEQQLARDRYLHDPQPVISRKLEEACLAIELRRRTPRRLILESYLNGAFYGHHAYGAEAASRTYFSRPAAHLSLTQAAMIAGLPQAPTMFDPVRAPVATRRRRDEVLAALRDAGRISPARYAAAVRRPLGLRPGSRYRAIRHPAFFEAARRELVQRYGARRVRRGGLQALTTIDERLQGLAETALGDWLRAPTDPSGALVAIDPASGAVRAMAVRGPSGGHLNFNLATQARRQAGSTFKTFTLTAAMEAGIPLGSVWQGPSSLSIPDRQCRTGNQDWVVHNYADETAGTMSLLQATAHSVNTIFAQVALRAGIARVADVAHRMGIESPLVPVCSLTLGPEGVSPLEMTDAFATLAARGIHHRPELLQRVTGPGGAPLGALGGSGSLAIQPDVADRVTYALSGVLNAGTGTAAYFGRPAAGKTGTAEGFKDAWFCGFVPQLAACAWIGHAGAEIPMSYVDGFAQVVGGSVPARIWRAFMEPAVSPLPALPLPTPSSVSVAPPSGARRP
ncbi:MAG: penicillin-binding protein [Candidatus Binatota bacterium]|nr:penicillin-binding protein [Candidatus Binatota bacterium]